MVKIKAYLVFDKKYNFYGVIYDKQDLEIFKQQRDMNNFWIDEITPKEIKTKYKELNLHERVAIMNHGVLMFPDEEIYMFEGFDQMYMDFISVMANLVRDKMPFIKLDDDEREVIDKFIKFTFDRLHQAELLLDSDQEFDEETIYDMTKLAFDAIAPYGGRVQ